MLVTIHEKHIDETAANKISDALETGNIVYFPRCPFPLPEEADLEFLRRELPGQLKLKNISYHPEAKKIRGIEGEPALVQRAERILVEHSERLQAFLAKATPQLADGCVVGTSSFRPIQEKGRKLKPHASNELVHIDAGAYGATNGDRIFRFFVNANPEEDRVWATKGAFPNLYEKYGRDAGIRPLTRGQLTKGPLDHMRTGLLKGLAAAGLSVATVVDSSPYDRVMRRFHNFMKDTPEFQQDPQNHQEIRFPPYSAWMVFTDMVSHASLSGQFALVNTNLIRLRSCRMPELAPINILRAA